MELRDKDRIRVFLRRDPALHVYELGDLDDFFWPHTTWFANDDVSAIALLYAPPQVAVLAAFAREPEPLGELVAQIATRLPPRIYVHLSPGLLHRLEPRYTARSHGPHLKMSLVAPERLRTVDVAGVDRLGPDDAAELARFYERCYPGNWFDPRMLDTRQYFAIREAGELAAAAGIHVYSETERVAAIGNITTAPELRGRGFGARVTARLCLSLLEHVDLVGLNVKADNAVAIRCYERLGFAHVAPYEELALE